MDGWNALATWKKVAIVVGGLVILGGVFGDSDEQEAAPAPAPVAPAPEPEPEPEPAPERPTSPDVPGTPEPSGEPFDLGDDPELDRLWMLCSQDDYDACDELFWESPLFSEYEAYALERLDELDEQRAPADDLLTTDFFMDLVWDGMDTEERAEICLGVGLFGADGAAEMIVAEAPDFPVDEVADWLTRACR